MEDRAFELMTRMYAEFSEFRNEFKDIKGDVADIKGDVAEIKNDVAGLKNDVAGLKGDVARIQIKLEHDIEPKIKVLFDDRSDIHEKLNSIEHKVDELTNRVDKQDLEIRVIKGGKPKAGKGCEI